MCKSVVTALVVGGAAWPDANGEGEKILHPRALVGRTDLKKTRTIVELKSFR